MNAWPAAETVLLDGWVLRAAGGYTKRANSVNPTYPALAPDLAAKVAICEQFYADRGLPAIFRLTDFGVPAGLDELLAARGYTIADPTIVMTRPLDPAADGHPDPGLLRLTPATFLDGYCRLHGVDRASHDRHQAILERIPAAPLYGAIADAGDVVACGLLVRDGDLAGIFDVITDPRRRRQGHARQLVGALLADAAHAGARTAYLQVVERNAAGRALWQALGFTPAYRYWYRVPPE